jgi:hypothetical protein
MPPDKPIMRLYMRKDGEIQVKYGDPMDTGGYEMYPNGSPMLPAFYQDEDPEGLHQDIGSIQKEELEELKKLEEKLEIIKKKMKIAKSKASDADQEDRKDDREDEPRGRKLELY